MLKSPVMTSHQVPIAFDVSFQLPLQTAFCPSARALCLSWHITAMMQDWCTGPAAKREQIQELTNPRDPEAGAAEPASKPAAAENTPATAENTPVQEESAPEEAAEDVPLQEDIGAGEVSPSVLLMIWTCTQTSDRYHYLTQGE
jgi:hypothetical protein